MKKYFVQQSMHSMFIFFVKDLSQFTCSGFGKYV